MEAAIECTHCKVVMTSWSAPGSPIRYYQCPFCARTHSSLYGEVFRSRAGARVLDGAPLLAGQRAPGIPMASPEDIRWAGVKQTAARWFARLEADQRRHGVGARPGRPPRAGIAPPVSGDVPEIDPDEVIEIAAPPRSRRR